MSVTLDDLASPASADYFRMTVDWGRWYIDPLPTCDIAEATEDRWPSCSTVKKAADKDWSFLTVNRIAALEPDELHRISALDHTQRGDAIRSHEKMAKNTAFGRGTIIHLWCEDLAAGHGPRDITEQWLSINRYPLAALAEALPYRNAIQGFFQTYQPEPIAAEYVTIHRALNGHGYGATPDGLFRIEGEIVAVDWKTRGESSSHAAYPEEAAQIACGARAEYMIAREGDHAERRVIPDVAGGYVVSIKPDGARLYPIDIDEAWAHWCHLHEWWTHRLDEKKSIGRVKPNRSKVAAPTSPGEQPTSTGSGVSSLSPDPVDELSSAGADSREASVKDGSGLPESPPSIMRTPADEPNWRFEAKRRYDLLNDDQRAEYTKRKAAIDTTSAFEVFTLLNEVEPFNLSATPDLTCLNRVTDAINRVAPDEGGTVDAPTIAALRQAFEALPDAAQLWISTLTAEGKTAGVDWRTGAMPSVRRFELGRAVIRLAGLLEGL